MHSRCDIRSHHCRFNRKCSTSTKRINKDTALIPRSELDKCSRQCLLNRCFADHAAVSSLMKALTRSIKTNCHNILINNNSNRIIGTIFLKPIDVVMLFHSLYHRLFYNGLNIGRAEKLTLYRGCLCHPKSRIGWEILFPRNLFHILEQFLKSYRLKLCHF